MQAFKTLFGQINRVVIGMVHVRALPGSPVHSLPFQDICEKAEEEARIYVDHGLNGIILENMHDVPYEKETEQKPHTVAFMTAIATKLREKYPDFPIGIQILSGANQQALAVAKAANLNFIRCEGFVFGHIGDEGYIDSCAGSLLRYRRYINAEDIHIFTDIKKKHSSHAITDDIDAPAVAKAAEMFLSDGIIVTGESTGVSPNKALVAEVKESVSLPVIIGSGANRENLTALSNFANAFIVGSEFKHNGKWYKELDKKRITEFMNKIKV